MSGDQLKLKAMIIDTAYLAYLAYNSCERLPVFLLRCACQTMSREVIRQRHVPTGSDTIEIVSNATETKVSIHWVYITEGV